MIGIGVDPGKTGAIVALNHDSSVYFCMDNAQLTDRDGMDRLNDLMFYATEKHVVAIERQQYMAKGGRTQGAKSAFTLGQNYGFWTGYFKAFYDVTITTPLPQEWQRYHFGSGTVISDPKQRSIREAQRRLPDLPLIPPRCRVPSHGRADAALIALYGLAWMEKESQH